MEWVFDWIVMVVVMAVIDVGLKYLVKEDGTDRDLRIFGSRRRNIIIVIGLMVVSLVGNLLERMIDVLLIRYVAQIVAIIMIMTITYKIISSKTDSVA